MEFENVIINIGEYKQSAFAHKLIKIEININFR